MDVFPLSADPIHGACSRRCRHSERDVGTSYIDQNVFIVLDEKL